MGRYTNSSSLESETQKMAFKASSNRKLGKQIVPKIDADAYIRIPASDLMLFSFQYIQEQGMQVNVEDVVSASFLLFPQKFALKHYPKWPDSALVSRRWSDCKAKRWISGDAENGFILSFKGARIAQQTAKALGLFKPVIKTLKKQPLPAKVKKTPTKKVRPVSIYKKVKPVSLVVTNKIAPKEKTSQPIVIKKVKHVPGIDKARPIWAEKSTPPVPIPVKRIAQVEKSQPAGPEKILSPRASVSKENKALASLAGKFVRVMERSDAYNVFRKNGGRANISEFDFRSLLLCTMESSAETLTRNVNLYKSYATIHHRQDLISLLDYCEVSFSYLLKKPLKTKK